jgi:signal transduction histidine kinase
MVRDTQGVLNDRVTSVLGYVELLLEESYGPLDAQQRRILSGVVMAAREVRDIIRDQNLRHVAD